MSDLPATPVRHERGSNLEGPSSGLGSRFGSQPGSSIQTNATSRVGSDMAGIPSTPGRRNNLNGNNRTFNAPRGTPASTFGADAPDDQVEEAMDQDEAPMQQELIWGTNVCVAQLERDVRDFFSNYKEDPTDTEAYYCRIMRNISENQINVNFINLDCQHILAHNPALYKTLKDYVENSIQIFDMIATEKYEEWFGLDTELQVRPYNLSDIVAMRDLDPTDINKLVSIKGMVIRVSPIDPDMQTSLFECSVCFNTEETPLLRGRINEPVTCQNCSTNFSMDIIHNRCKFKDKQYVKLQEAPETIPDGQTPHTIVLVCVEEFKDAVQPGDRVTVTGMFQASSIRPNKNNRCIKSIFKTHVEVFHFRKSQSDRIARDKITDSEEFTSEIIDVHKVTEEEEEMNRKLEALAHNPNVYDVLCRSFAPGIWQHEDIKRGILCQLFGGVNKNLKEQGLGRARGDINILLCGDPGTSKSQFLAHVHKIAPRGIYTSGKGSSSVGLTAYVSKDPVTKELVLESGALVLSDGGICCIDEFDKMTESTRSVLHEAMEQQTISIAKAGVICTLNARTSVLAAANPINSSWNPRLSIVENLNLPPTLLSRFDLIYLVLDQPDPVNDRQLARHIASMYTQGDAVQESTDDTITPELFARYISYAREKIQPTITSEAGHDLIQAYLELRQFGGSRKTIAATPRQLESLIRVSEALARMRFSEEVNSDDVKEALRLVKSALCQSVTDPNTGMVDMSIITTGLSETTRQKQAQLGNEFKEFLGHQDRSGSRLRLRDLINDWNHSNSETSLQQLRDVCNILHDEGFLSYDRRADTIIIT